jgi:quercetin dioxygenase-like cupin family protein
VTESNPKADTMDISRIDKAQAKPVSPDNFKGGEVRAQMLQEAADERGVQCGAVFFPAGARTRPHTHPVEQVLYVVEGEGVLAFEDEKRIIKAGDWARILPGVWHWHGATDTSDMCHVSIKQPGPEKWDEPWQDWDAYMDGVER